MNMQPLNDFVLVRPLPVEEKTVGGLFLPETARERPNEGIILALPEGGVGGVALQDRVIYRAHAGEEVRWNGEVLRLVPTGDLLAKVIEADAIEG